MLQKRKCLGKFALKEMMEWRKGFWKMQEGQKRQFLLNAFALNTYCDGTKRKCSFKIRGRAVCAVGWYKALGISNGW